MKVSLYPSNGKNPTALKIMDLNGAEPRGLHNSKWQKGFGLMPLNLRAVDYLRMYFPDELEEDEAVTGWYARDRQRRSMFQKYVQHDVAEEDTDRWHDLRPYQQEFASFAMANAAFFDGARILLEDDPRLGKTVQAITAMQILGFAGLNLIICDNSLQWFWREQLKEWLPLIWDDQIHILNGPISDRLQNITIIRERSRELPIFVITNYPAVRLMPELARISWTWVIADEAHALKNRKSKISKAMGLVMKSAKHRLLASATFTEAGPQDYYSPLQIILPERFKSYWQFVGHYCQTVPDYFAGIKILGALNDDFLLSTLAPIRIRRRAKDVLDMPNVVEETITVKMGALQANLYQRMKEDFLIKLSVGDMDIPNQAARLVRLRQVALAAEIIEPELEAECTKFDALVRLVKERTELRPFVVFCNYVAGVNLAAKYLRGVLDLKVFIMRGGTDAKMAVELLDNGKIDAIVANPKVGGVGLNLAAASWTIYLDLPWSTIMLRQSKERTRIAEKTGSVLVTYLVAAGTVDLFVHRTLTKKLENISRADLVTGAVEYLKNE